MFQRKLWYLVVYALVLFGPMVRSKPTQEASANPTLGGTPCHVFAETDPTPMCQSQALLGHPPSIVVGTDCTTEDVPDSNRGTRQYFDIQADGGMRLFAGVRDEGVNAGPSQKTVRTMKWSPGPNCPNPPPCHPAKSACEASGITTIVIDPPHKKHQTANASTTLSFTIQRGTDGCGGTGAFSDFQANQQTVSWTRSFDHMTGMVVDTGTQTTTVTTQVVSTTTTATLADHFPDFEIAPDGKTLATSNGAFVNPSTDQFQSDAHLMLTVDGSIGLLHSVHTKMTTTTVKVVATVTAMSLEDTNDPP